ncbi:MAG: NADH-quinone oxidoreductase subunit K [Polyangiaceae bacterium]|jgi:multicomponent K+:H+ antiporter subunit C|nr:NADH-quinone oxidoreductase subunit K [Polyangiaceae bacterium]
MELVVVMTVFLLTSVGVYLLMARRTFPTILGVSLIGHAVNVIVLSAGRVRSKAPLLRQGDSSRDLVETMADPMPQALVLTAIVISMAITLYLIAVMGLTAKREGIIDVERIPESDDDRDEDEVRQELSGTVARDGRTTADSRQVAP